MRAGILRHQIVIQQSTPAQDSYGQPIASWSTFAAVHAAIHPLVGSEYQDAKQINSQLTHLIRIRYRAGVSTDMRILFGTRIFDIESIVDLKERNREMHLRCIEQL